MRYSAVLIAFAVAHIGTSAEVNGKKLSSVDCHVAIGKLYKQGMLLVKELSSVEAGLDPQSVQFAKEANLGGVQVAHLRTAQENAEVAHTLFTELGRRVDTITLGEQKQLTQAVDATVVELQLALPGSMHDDKLREALKSAVEYQKAKVMMYQDCGLPKDKFKKVGPFRIASY